MEISMSKFMNIFNFFQNSPFKKTFFKILYNNISPRLDQSLGIRYMNYGYLDLKDTGPCPSIEEVCTNLYSLFLKEYKISKNLELGIKVLEVGAGLGGGLLKLAKLYPNSIFSGIDLSSSNIKISNNNAKDLANIHFIRGDAENIPFENDSYDLVVNVESSHCYINLDRFFHEVYRVLKDEGYFYYADFTPVAKGDSEVYISILKDKISCAGLEIVIYRDITGEVLNALDKTQALKEDLMKSVGVNVKKYSEFAAMVGSEAYSYFKNQESIYFSMLIQKRKIT